MSTETLATALARPKVSLDQLLLCSAPSSTPLSQKSRKKLLTLLKASVETSQGLLQVATLMKTISRDSELINAFARDSTAFASLVDRILVTALSAGSSNLTMAQKISIVRLVYELIQDCSLLKGQLCMTVNEYCLSAFERATTPSPLLSTTAELLVISVTHHPDNRRYFARRTSLERIQAVHRFLKTTGDPLGQIFAAEFLWRIGTLMSLSEQEKKQGFGDHYEKLLSINKEGFNQGILEYVRTLNEVDGNVHNFKIRDLRLGGIEISGDHWLDIGTDAAVLWLNKNAEWSEPGIVLDLLVMKAEDIAGVGEKAGRTGIVLKEQFDTLPQCFARDSKRVLFEPVEKNPNAERLIDLCKRIYGSVELGDVPEKMSATPQPKLKHSMKHKIVPQTPKPVLNQRKNGSNESKSDDLESSDDGIDVLSLDKPIKTRAASRKGSQIQEKEKIKKAKEVEKAMLKKEKKRAAEEAKRQKQREEEEKESERARKAAEIEKAKRKELKRQRKEEQQNIDLEIDETIKETATEATEVTELANDVSIPVFIENTNVNCTETQPLSIKRTYAPERWELDAFDEMKTLSTSAKTMLNERREFLMSSIDTAVNASIQDISEFMNKSDNDLESIRLSFINTSKSIADDITSKQKMVGELGAQQFEHIEQMSKECSLLQKRAQEIMSRFDTQKKNLISNQEKHIALFREDIRSDVKSMVSNKKLESSKNIVQKLVNLLDGL